MEAFVSPIEITPAGEGSEQQKQVLRMVEPSRGFPAVANLLVDVIVRESLTTVLDFSPKSAVVRFQVDGMWQNGPVLDRESGDFMLATLKKIAGLDYRERRKRQEGKFTTLFNKVRQTFRVVSQGIPTGERTVIYANWKRPPMETLDQLGMRASMQAQLSQVISNPKTGLVLVTALPGEGYTAAWRGVLTHCDRLTRDYFVIEEVQQVEQEVINVYTVPFDRSRGENAMSPITQLLLKQPDVLAFNELPDKETIDSVVDLSVRQKTPIFVRAPGKSCLDGLLRLIAMQPNVENFVNRLDAIVSMRLVRKLCEKCKVGFQPATAMLQKLGLPPGRIAQLYNPHILKLGATDEKGVPIPPCPNCLGVGYKGRTGVFELLTMTDELRQAILANPRLDHLISIAQQQRHISLQQEGVVHVAKGTTSIDELQRVLKT